MSGSGFPSPGLSRPDIPLGLRKARSGGSHLEEAGGGQRWHKLHWITSRQAVTDPQSVVSEVIDTYSADYPALEQFRSRQASLVTANFVEGREDAWRERTNDEIRSRMWDAMSSEIRTTLDLAA